PEGDTCSIAVSADYTELFGECINVGGLPPGSECNDEDDPNELPYEERCSAFYCFGDMCSEVCQVDTDCPEGMICEVLQFSNVDDTINVCMGDTSCGSPADCPEGESCWPTLSGDALAGWCRPNEGTDPVGTECTDADDTCEVFCMEPRCTEWCTLDSDCPDTMICEAINFCLAEPCTDPNNVAPGTICIQDGGCGAPTDCDAGSACWPTLNAEGGLEGWCRANGGPDPVGTECTEADDTCEVFCMEPRCTEWCTLDTDCPGTMICETINFCIAEPCTDPNNQAPGTICIQDDSCGAPADCEAGFGCWPTLGADGGFSGWCRADEGADVLGTACTMADDTCEVLCAGGETDGLCSEVCTVDADCDAAQNCLPLGLCIADPCTDPNNVVEVDMCQPAA
ncbi:MAG: hypothetical protein KAI66_12070, partial [Lentisphaeria bacterium]|nr:hypothetical protein [Lentisphaeria bacterium]